MKQCKVLIEPNVKSKDKKKGTRRQESSACGKGKGKKY